MTKKLNANEAKNIAKDIINSHISSFSQMKGKAVLLDNNIIMERRFWIFFWDDAEQVFSNNPALKSGFGCLINDRGEIRTIFDIRKRPEKLSQFIKEAKKWSERPE